jgi:hypothetical protein
MHRPIGARRRPWLQLVVLCSTLLLSGSPARALTVGFEDVGASLPSQSAVNDSGGFESGGAGFNNLFQDFGGGFTSWAGFAYSNVQDATTPGVFNQYAAWPGGGAGGSATYAVGFQDFFVPLEPRITFASDVAVQSVRIANTTYAALSMKMGDSFAKKFGGVAGDDPDFFRLTIRGLDAGGQETASLEFYLADYRSADAASDFVLETWALVDLSSLGVVRSLSFGLESSDVGPFGINTPTYFALDDLVAVPEPGSLLLLVAGLAGLATARRRG